MLLQFPPRVPGSSLKRGRVARRKVNQDRSLARLELFGFEIDRRAADASRQVYWTLSKDGRVERASREVTTRGRRMCSVVKVKVDTGSGLPYARPSQTNGRHQRVSCLSSVNVGVVQCRLIGRRGFASPREIKDRRRVMLANFVGPEFGIRTKQFVTAHSRLAFEVEINPECALVLQHDKIPSLRV